MSAHRPWIIAHRGASGHAPENTMAAFRLAASMGAQFLETDLHLTRDARFVAIHDLSLERTTSGRGNVREHSLESLQALDAGSWFDPKFSGEKIPTLDEILGFACEADLTPYLEIKFEGAFGMHHGLILALKEHQMASRAVLLAFDAATLAGILRLDPTLMTGLLVDAGVETAVERALALGVRQLVPRADLITPEIIAQAHDADLKVVAWTVNEPEHMRALAAAGVNGIMSDYPDRLRATLWES
ncbi:MAG: glycerophosphodiester phosphodiesterase [Candidatus Acidiferrales bacterium]